MTREERNELLADLRAAGVKRCEIDAMGGLVSASFFAPAAPPRPVADEDRPLPRPKRTLDQRLMDPLGIAEKPEAP